MRAAIRSVLVGIGDRETAAGGADHIRTLLGAIDHFVHKELGAELLKRVEEDLGDLAVVEQRPKMEGRQMIMIVAPKK